MAFSSKADFATGNADFAALLASAPAPGGKGSADTPVPDVPVVDVTIPDDEPVTDDDADVVAELTEES
mgnify:CR=1 FL=1